MSSLGNRDEHSIPYHRRREDENFVLWTVIKALAALLIAIDLGLMTWMLISISENTKKISLIEQRDNYINYWLKEKGILRGPENDGRSDHGSYE